jgi:hypothetical protein
VEQAIRIVGSTHLTSRAMFGSVMNFAGRRARFSLASEMPVSGRFPVGENEVRWGDLLPAIRKIIETLPPHPRVHQAVLAAVASGGLTRSKRARR